MSGIFGNAGLRTIAVFEAAKGLAVLLLAMGALRILDSGDAEEAARSLMIHLHISPSRHLSGVILDALNRVTDAEMWGLAGAAIAYCGVRLTEAWGLWFGRVWAEWFSLLSGAMYLPWECVEWVTHPTWFHATLVIANTAIVLYMGALRWRGRA